MQIVMETCLLCRKPSILRESHLIPKYIFKWLKDTGSGYLRSGEDLNLRIQDGPKHHFLCQDCENLFSNYETYFARQIFYPVVNDNAEAFIYSEKLQKFVISVLWRLVKHDFLPEERDPAYHRLLLEVENDWSGYLLGKHPSALFDRVYLICGVDLRHPDEIGQIEVPDRLIYYFARQVDAGVTGNNEHKFIYLKLPRMLFIVPIQGLPNTCFQNAMIKDGGTYELENAGCLEPLIGRYFYDRIHDLNGLHNQISPRQKQKIADVTREKWEEVKNKDLGIILDYQNRQ